MAIGSGWRWRARSRRGRGAIVAHNICRGLDLAATADVHRTILDFAAGGGAVLLISSDLDELLAICGRLLMISGGKIRETNPG